MEKNIFLYEGKAKRIYKTSEPEVYLIEYKDDLTAFNAEKKSTLAGKGRLNNRISSYLFTYLEKKGIPSHFIAQVDDVRHTARKVTILPLEVVVRNITTGSLCKRLGVEENQPLPRPLVEFYLKDDSLGDPIVTEDHAVLFGWASQEDLQKIKETALKINHLLRGLFKEKGIILVDFKIEFGKTSSGELLLADEISPDTCRFWDEKTMKKLDKDRFRKDLGDVLGAYREILYRLTGEEL
jgi:phosphoribosylaminoimidazole-succinocarboxamide synthase